MQDTGTRDQGPECVGFAIFCAKIPRFFSRLLALAKSRWLPVIASDLWRALQPKAFGENQLGRKKRCAEWPIDVSIFRQLE